MMTYINFHTHKPTAEGVVTPRSFGIHPWHADEQDATTFDDFNSQYDDAFSEAQIIGECGLDKVCRSDWDRQMQLFGWQCFIADRQNKPMVIHCVHAFNELLQLRRQHPTNIWIVHGFTGSIQLARQLFLSDIWVSYGAALLDSRRTKVHQCLQLNDNPFLLETDDATETIEQIYQAAAAIKNIPLPSLADTIKQHYLSLNLIP